MRLTVRVIEARNIPAMDLSGSSDPYVRLQLGKQRSRTRVVKKSLSPTWEEEFIFKIDDLSEELVVTVMDEDRYFSDDFVGHVKLPISDIFDAHNNSLRSLWYPLQPRNKKSKNKDCGAIHLNLSFSHNGSFKSMDDDHGSRCSNRPHLAIEESPSRSFARPSTAARLDEVASVREDKPCAQKSLVGRIAQIFNKNTDTAATTSKVVDVLDVPEPTKPAVSDDNSEDQSSSDSFEQVMKSMECRDQGGEIPSNLPGGVLVDQMYVIAPQDLNSLLFSPDSSFYKSWWEEQGTTELQMKPWKFENGGHCLKRELNYLKAATRLVKATRTFEEQTYLKADGKSFAVLSSVSTPDIIYGGTFKTEILHCITPGPELSSGEQSSHLVISWRLNFLQSTMMKGMIENGARTGLKDPFDEFANFLSQSVKPVDSKDMGLNKEQILASLQAEPQSDWKLAMQYFCNFTVVSSTFMGLYLLLHMWLAAPSVIQGLEFVGLDLPDSIGEVIVCAVLVLQGQLVLGLISRFMQARKQKGSDHGIKAQGEGWLLTVALINGSNLAAVDSSGFCDPYVVFTCNGKTRTSSIKFQQSDPQWNEIFEFDAMDEPPSVLDVEVYNFDGPFDETTSLGHAEINFVKSNISDLADVWIPLQGKLAMACQSRLHLRIFLNNTKGGNMIRNYLSKMEKEVGKKINLRSPQTNSAFQKLFGLPPEEFLINDFTCHLKRKMPRQGRLFLSARIIGFHANLFGHKTKFFFLWEDIEDIQVLPPSLSSMGSPVMAITLRKGRGMDARHGAKVQDEEGRLKFYFQSFVSYNVANRTIMALWKARSLSPEQKVKIVEEESEAKSLQSEESGAFLDLDDVAMSEVYTTVLPVPIQFLMELFAGGELDRTVMEKTGCIDYSCSPWDSEKPDVYERQIYYRLDKSVSRFGGEVTSTQQKSPMSNGSGWLVEEVITLHGVPVGDYFNLHLRYQIGDMSSRQGCVLQVFAGTAWLKSTRHMKRITKNILENLEERLKMMLSIVEKEFAQR